MLVSFKKTTDLDIGIVDFTCDTKTTVNLEYGPNYLAIQGVEIAFWLCNITSLPVWVLF